MFFSDKTALFPIGWLGHSLTQAGKCNVTLIFVSPFIFETLQRDTHLNEKNNTNDMVQAD